MAISVQWNNEEMTAIRYQFTDPWSWLELRRRLRVGFALSRSVQHTVDIIFDLTDARTAPENPVEHALTLRPFIPSNIGTMVFISQDATVSRTLVKIYQEYRAQGLSVLMVNTLEQAEHLLLHERFMAMTGARL